jgi:hypothetical protein
MAAHWATEAVHVVPVFGESGALLEHKVFTWFYNVPLTLRGRMGRRAEARSSKPSRLWHALPLGAIGATALLSTQYYYGQRIGHVPTLAEIWWAMLALPLLCGSIATLSAGGATLGGRMIGATLCGACTGVLFSLSAFGIAGWVASPVEIFAGTVWVVFILAVLSPIGALLTELVLPEP